MNHSRTVCPFCLNGGVCSGKGSSVFISFCENGTITLYCHMPCRSYMTVRVCVSVCNMSITHPLYIVAPSIYNIHIYVLTHLY